MNTKVKIFVITTLLLLFSGAAHAVSWIYFPSGAVVFQPSYTTPSGVTYLKLELADGSKLNADCMYSDQILQTCHTAKVGDTIVGAARCELGVCSYLDLHIIRIITRR